MNQVLNENERLLKQVINKDIVNIVVNSSVNNAYVDVHECKKCLSLETELLNKKDFIEKETYDKLFRRYATLEKHYISLEVDTQLNQEIFQKDNSVSNQSAPNFDQYFKLNELKAQSQEKDTIITKLKERIKYLSENVNKDKVKKDIDEIETINIELDHKVSKLIAENEHLKQTYKQLYDSIKPISVRSKEQCDALITQVNQKSMKISDLNGNLQEKGVKPSTSASGLQPSGNTKKDKIQRPPSSTQKNKHSKLNANYELICVNCNGYMPSDNHDLCVLNVINDVNARPKSKSVKKTSKKKVWKPTGKVVQFILWYLDFGCSKQIIRYCSQLTNFINKFLGTVKFRNDHVEKIMGYGDYHIGNVTISKVYYVEGLGYNLFSVRQFCDLKLEVAFRQHTCFIRNLEGVDLLTGSRGNNLYKLSLGDMMASSPICLLSKTSKTKSWIWHRRLSHLNFGTINHLARHGLVRGLPKLKFKKDHLCFACAMGKSKKKPHKPKSEDTNQEKLYLFHMDLCGPMRVASVNRKKYILIIVDDYSRFTWVGISHETSVARSPQQNGVVERCNRMLIEAARTMLIYVKALLFLCLEPALHEMTPATISLGLIPNPPPLTLVDPPPPEVIASIAEVVAPEPAKSTSSPSSTIVDQDAPSPSNSQTLPKTQSSVISNDVKEENHDLNVAHMNNDPFFGILIPENDSDSSSSDVIPTVVHTSAPNSEHVNIWTKDHPLDNIVIELERPVFTRL
nr:hypothetical protein [Tanacetum cinerariifolium]